MSGAIGASGQRLGREEKLEDRRKQIAACLEGLIYSDHLDMDAVDSRTPRPPAARHIAPTRRHRDARGNTPPQLPTTRPNISSEPEGRCSASPIPAGEGATSGYRNQPVGHAMLPGAQKAANSRVSHDDWEDYWQLLGPHLEPGEGNAYSASNSQATAPHPLGGEQCNLHFTHSPTPSAQLEQALTPSTWDIFARFELFKPEATPPQEPAPIPHLLQPRGSELTYVATPFIEFDFPSYEDNMEFEGTETARALPSPSPSPSSETAKPLPSPRLRPNPCTESAAPLSPKRKSASGSSLKSTSAAAHAAQRPRPHRPHASVEKRYRAGINEKIEALRQCLEMRKRPKHAKLHEDLMAACTSSSPFSSAPSEDGSQSLANTTDVPTSPSGGPDDSTPAPPSARMNKASVLIEACDYIQQLEEENAVMMEQLRSCVGRLRTTRQALLLLTQPPSAFPSSSPPPAHDGRGTAGGRH